MVRGVRVLSEGVTGTIPVTGGDGRDRLTRGAALSGCVGGEKISPAPCHRLHAVTVVAREEELLRKGWLRWRWQLLVQRIQRGRSVELSQARPTPQRR